MKHLMLLGVCLLFCWGCGSGGIDEPVPESQPGYVPSITFPSSQTFPIIGQEGGTSFFSFTSTADWTVDISPMVTRVVSWISVQPTVGRAGEVTLTITTLANETPDERCATVTLKAGVTSKIFTVNQKQKDALTVTSNKIEVPFTGEQVRVEVKANVNYEYEIDPTAQSWISCATTRGIVSSELIFNVAENENTNKREGKIVIRKGELSETVTIYQEGSKPSIILTQNEYTVSSKGEKLKVELRSNVDYEVRLPNIDWMYEVKTRAFSNHTHYFVVAPNETYSMRTAEIAFINKENGMEKIVKVIQMQQDAIVVAQSECLVSSQGGTLNFEVNANIDFTVTISVDWIKRIVETKGLTANLLHFTIAENSLDEMREGVITLKGNDVVQDIVIKQFGRVQSDGNIDDMPIQPW